MMGSSWQPMETAPKDGRPIIALWGRGAVALKVAWDGERWRGDTWADPLPLKAWMPLQAVETSPRSGVR